MNYTEYLDRITFSDKGKALFCNIHEKLSSSAFGNVPEKARAAYDAGDAAFGEYVSELSTACGFLPEELTFYLYILFSEITLRRCIDLGIPEKVFFDSIATFARNCERTDELYGLYGIQQQVYRGWFRRNLEPCLFRLGRLEFELLRCPWEIAEFGINLGETVISVHIPKGDTFTEKDCEAAYDTARDFFKKYFNIEKCFFLCESWLLHPWLRQVLPENSSIINFQRKFRIVKTAVNPASVLNWVFPGSDGKDLSQFPQKTSLQRAVLNALETNTEIGTAVGIRL